VAMKAAFRCGLSQTSGSIRPERLEGVKGPGEWETSNAHWRQAMHAKRTRARIRAYARASVSGGFLGAGSHRREKKCALHRG
jgi:hypothetical protein